MDGRVAANDMKIGFRKIEAEAMVRAGCLAALVVWAAGGVWGADVGNCLMCHKYPGLGRVDEQGNLRLFFINEETFNNSVHSKVKCEGCHSDIDKIPHTDAKKVDCLAQCHIIEPTSEQKFSHQTAAHFLSKSVHSKLDADGNPKAHPDDYPECKDCHDNPLFRPVTFSQSLRPGISQEALGRCRVCHQSDDFIFQYYNHVTTRLHKIRNPKNIAEVCGRCHDDPGLVARHGLQTQAAVTYEDSFHGKAASFLKENIPDCLDCHVREGESVHQMLSHEDSRSSTHPSHKAASCSSMDCHPNASPKLATYDVHAAFKLDQSPGQFYFTLFFIFLTGGVLLPLMVVIFLDLMRRMFPNFVFARRR